MKTHAYIRIWALDYENSGVLITTFVVCTIIREKYHVVNVLLSRMAEESEIDSDEEVVNSWGLRQSLVLFWVPIWDQNHYDFTVDTNRSRFIGCDKKDQRALIRYWAHFDNFPIMIERVFLSRSLEMSPNIKYYSEEEYPHRDFALSCGIRASFCFFIGDGIMEIVSTRNQDIVTLDTFCKSL